MSAAPLELYGVAHASGGNLHLRLSCGCGTPLQVSRWLRPADAVDLSVVERCRGPVLDLGCGPGRMVTALASCGVPALGVDVAGAAVSRAISSGALALCRDVFGPLPGEGRWGEVLLIDGNVGIGGDVSRLLGRIYDLLAPAGRVVVEVDADERVDQTLAACLEDGLGRRSAPFRWARAGSDAVIRRAAVTGLELRDAWQRGGRSFVLLSR